MMNSPLKKTIVGVCACCRHKLTMSFKQHEVCQKDEVTETEDNVSF